MRSSPPPEHPRNHTTPRSYRQSLCKESYPRVHGQVGNDWCRQGSKRRTSPPPNFTQRAVPVTSRCLSISIVPLSLSPPLSLTLPLSSQFCLSASSDKVAGSPSLYMFSLYLMSLHISLSLHLLSLYISLCHWIWRAKTNVAPTPCVNAKRATNR